MSYECEPCEEGEESVQEESFHKERRLDFKGSEKWPGTLCGSLCGNEGSSTYDSTEYRNYQSCNVPGKSEFEVQIFLFEPLVQQLGEQGVACFQMILHYFVGDGKHEEGCKEAEYERQNRKFDVH